MAEPNLALLNGVPSIRDYRQAEEEFRLQKQMQAMQKLAFIQKLQNGGADSKPSSIAEWEAYQAMPQEQQKEYLQMKRANPYNLAQNLTLGPDGTVAPQVGAPKAVQQLAAAGELGTQSVQVPASATKTINDQRVKAGMQPVAMLDAMAAGQQAVAQQRQILGTQNNAPQRERGGEQIFLPDSLGSPLDPQDMGMPVIPTDASLAADKVAAETKAKGEITPAAEKETSQKMVDDITRKMMQKLGDLDNMGAVVNSDNGLWSNLAASFGASVVGQYLGKVSGSKSQNIIGQLNQVKKPLGLHIVKAMGGNSKAFDSNTELKVWTDVPYDPTESLQTSIEKINAVRRLSNLQPIEYTKNAQPPAPDVAPPVITDKAKAYADLKSKHAELTGEQITEYINLRGAK
jgi:hypothetical protein